MGLRDDERAVTAQLGAVLLLGVVVLLLAGYQAVAVPADTERIEFAHNERVQGQLADVRNAILDAGTSGTDRAASVTLGTRYPSRTVAINPPPATGSFGTDDFGANATVANATPLGEDAAAFWKNRSMTYETAGFTYAPQYNGYDGAPTTEYEHTVLYNRFDGGSGSDRLLPVTDQRLVDGRTVTLLTLRGNRSRAGLGTVALDPTAVSPSTTEMNTIAVANDTATSNVTLRLPTRLDAETWRDLLADEPYVAESEVTVAGDVVEIPLRRTTADGEPITYNLRVAAVTLDADADSPDPAYVALVDGENASVPNGTRGRLVAEVRDRYNNPVSGAAVNVTFEKQLQALSVTQSTTAESGRAAFDYRTAGTGLLTALIELASGGSAATVLESYAGGSDAPLALPSDRDVVSGRDGRARVVYRPGGDGEFDASLSLAGGFTATAALASYGGGGTDDGFPDLGDGVAWEDLDGDGEFDESETVDVSNGTYDNESHDLYVLEGTGNITATTIEFNAKNVYLEPDFTATSPGNNENKIVIRAQEDVIIDGVSLEVTGANGDISITSLGGNVSARNTTASVQKQGIIDFRAANDVDASDATFNAAKTQSEVRLTADTDGDGEGTVRLVRTTVDADAGGFAEGVVVNVTDACITVGSKGTFDVRGQQEGQYQCAP